MQIDQINDMMLALNANMPQISQTDVGDRFAEIVFEDETRLILEEGECYKLLSLDVGDQAAEIIQLYVDDLVEFISDPETYFGTANEDGFLEICVQEMKDKLASLGYNEEGDEI